MSDENLALTDPSAPAVKRRASQELAQFIGMDAGAMIDVIRAQCFRPKNNEVITDAQVAAFISIAVEMKVNPLLPGMLYAFPIQGGGIVPMMGPDGVFKKLSENPNVEGWEVTVFPEDQTKPPTHAVAKLWRKGIERPLTYTAVLSEWKMNANPNWASRPRHMLTIRALKQVARQVIHGIPFDEDERQMMQEIDVTPPGETPKREQAPAKATPTTGAAGAVEEKKTTPAPVDGDFTMATKSGEPVTTLADKESRTFTCKVVEFTTAWIDSGGASHASVRVQLDGEFKGNAIHLGGATANQTDVTLPPIANPAYVVGKTVAITLLGKKRNPTIDPVTKAETPRPSAILVEAVKAVDEVVAPAAETPAPATSEVD